jgi:hypothetical protein
MKTLTPAERARRAAVLGVTLPAPPCSAAIAGSISTARTPAPLSVTNQNRRRGLHPTSRPAADRLRKIEMMRSLPCETIQRERRRRLKCRGRGLVTNRVS